MAAPDYIPATDAPDICQLIPQRFRAVGSKLTENKGGSSSRRLGSPGPDQGYIYKFIDQFSDRLVIGALKRDDIIAGCVAVATRRAGLFGRGPIPEDLEAAFSIYGFMATNSPVELVELRDVIFQGVSHAHHYMERRAVVDRVNDVTLTKSPEEIRMLVTSDLHQVIEMEV